MRLLRTLLVFTLGAYAGMAAAAALVKRALPSRGDAESDELALVAVFDGVELASRAQALRGGTLLAWFGGISLDLREATLAPGARLTVNAVLGGIAVKIPAGWQVESKVDVLAGGVDVKALAATEAGAPTLTLDGRAVLGGISVASTPGS